MAGYVVKIVLEDTHPPVWRRLTIPERISFLDLHEMIQIAFGWENCHLADFSGPSNQWRAEAEDCRAIDSYLQSAKWIRYTYDFGDEWRHKITLEKIDEEYDKRYATLVKYKGDGFAEDSGGVWGGWDDDFEHRVPFDFEDTQCQLESYISDEKNICEPDEEEQMVRDFIDAVLRGTKVKHKENTETKPEPRDAYTGQINRNLEHLKKHFDKLIEMKEKDNGTEQLSLDFLRTSTSLPKLTPKTVAELLKGLSEQQAKDYCKYLHLDVNEDDTVEHKGKVIAEFWSEHPEYLLYVLDADDITALQKYVGPKDSSKTSNLSNVTLQKAVMLGLIDVECIEDTIRLNPAEDLGELLGKLTSKQIKSVYKRLDKFAKNLRALILTYGMMDFDALYDAYCRMNKKPMVRVEFERCVYWHAQFNRLIATCENRETKKRYAVQLGLDVDIILDKTEKYAANLNYALKTREQLLDDNGIETRGDSPNRLFDHLFYGVGLEISEATFLIEEIFRMVLSGFELDAILSIVYGTLDMSGADLNLIKRTSFWEDVVMTMLETELPMLKGRSRNLYSEETGKSPWTVGMIDDIWDEDTAQMADTPIYVFPAKVQSKMYEACAYANSDAINWLLKYKKSKRIKSEEYTCLLAQACCMSGHFKEARILIDELKQGTKEAQEAAPMLEDMLENGVDVMDDFDEFYDDFDEPYDFDEMSALFNWRAQRELEELEIPKPYSRETKKVGRNEPCPCGSGKKFKNCCGKNS